MLASKYRLKYKSSFVRVEIDGKLSQFKYFGLGVYDRKDEDPSLFGFVISTKISKRAVVRNRIKRFFSDHIRLNFEKIKPGLDVIFLIKPSILKIDRELIEKEINEAISKNL
ncbi:ribonuclease P protein component [Candidatus Woesebacteria bacterium RIFOXYC1_FULL_31_51]|uniref:Ribonuclease P protein component n=1 Tax=Candidatus Woesebacteria bacterium GW2011_GWC2_31_9 TaxID=1618586 RepID=A0A0F9Z007_9BACT|nr:MAG: ribonuclease P, ribonuclease P protein component [Candidatus Woesebacteria bacterium GW2011_GWF1_31_35]KKP23218.1 MAG: Ribonuclease P protein component [Candidatus Woesebacteria bacterium GW2011_GWC1_30_29]KKP25531.1 MAG: Ribonuclease P protein component [Candidatus Woesebacteria bacterium GW2011_GWD1_31_12]KKP27480.1 MAG: Ribonuclease P protein component [Candidatus Woesebacteria bacterium GW2011_GWB1_31_29]KKP32001.1 MAG: Ribonuclease P protein component [Candidatus Woesebacteria bact